MDSAELSHTKNRSECWKRPHTSFLCWEAIPLWEQSLPWRALLGEGWQSWAAKESKEAVTSTLQCDDRVCCAGWMDGWPYPCPFSSLPMLNNDLSATRLGGECFSGPKAKEIKWFSLSVDFALGGWRYFSQNIPSKTGGLCKFIMSLRNLFNQLPFPGGTLHLMRDMMEGIKTGLQEFSLKPLRWCVSDCAVIQRSKWRHWVSLTLSERDGGRGNAWKPRALYCIIPLLSVITMNSQSLPVARSLIYAPGTTWQACLFPSSLCQLHDKAYPI